MPTQTEDRPLDSTGVKVLLCIARPLPLWRRAGDTGLRITDHGDAVLVEAIGYATRGEGIGVIARAHQALTDAGLEVQPNVGSAGGRPSRLVRRPS
jgi:Ni,Fe-hydrogenase III large subunit